MAPARHLTRIGMALVALAALVAAGSGRARADEPPPGTPPGAPDVLAPVLARLRGQFAAEVEPTMATALGCEASRAALARANAWRREVTTLVGSDSDDFAAQFATIGEFQVRTLVGCYDEAYALCKNLENPKYGFDMLQTQRELAVLGEEEAIDREKADRCLTFALVFDSVIDHKDTAQSGAVAYHHHVHADVPGLRLLASEQEAEGAIAYVDFAAGGPGFPCTWAFTGTEASFLRARQAPRRQPISSETLPDFALVLTMGSPRRVSTVSCPGSTTTDRGGLPWTFVFRAMHEAEVAGTALGEPVQEFVIRDWLYEQGTMLYSKRYTRSRMVGASPFEERTTLELRHTPR